MAAALQSQRTTGFSFLLLPLFFGFLLVVVSGGGVAVGSYNVPECSFFSLLYFAMNARLKCSAAASRMQLIKVLLM